MTVTITTPTQFLADVAARLEAAGQLAEMGYDGLVLHDPDGVWLVTDKGVEWFAADAYVDGDEPTTKHPIRAGFSPETFATMVLGHVVKLTRPKH